MAAAESRLAVMGGHGHLVVVDAAPGELSWAADRLHDIEQHWSRFVASSDVCRLMEAGGQPVDVHADTLVLLATMTAAQRFDGFDPSAGRGEHPARQFVAELDLTAGTATVPAGTWIDPGSIGKGLAADLVADELVSRGARAALVNLGGDLRAAGDLAGRQWTVHVESAHRPGHTVITLGLDAGGVATSSTLHPIAERAGQSRAHLIDPASGRPVASDLVAVTVVAPTGWMAEAAATSAIVTGTAAAYRMLAANGLEAVLQTTSGQVLTTPGLTIASMSSGVQ